MKCERPFTQHAEGIQGLGGGEGFTLILLNSKIIQIRKGWFVT
jgi:hypothetical protein